MLNHHYPSLSSLDYNEACENGAGGVAAIGGVVKGYKVVNDDLFGK